MIEHRDAIETAEARERERLIERHLPLVESLARRFSWQGEPLDDLVQIGTIGLINAVDRFRPERGAELTTFATLNIVGEIKRHLRDRSALVRVPRRVQETSRALRRSQPELASRLQRTPSVSELATAAGVAEVDAAKALQSEQAWMPLSLAADTLRADSELLGRLGVVEDAYAATEDRVLLAGAFRALDVRERRILQLRFFAGMSQAQIAREVGISQIHVSRLIRGALEKLRERLAVDEGDVGLARALSR